MSMLVFFPWLEMRGQGEIANLRLMEYKRGELPAGSGTAIQQEIDSILELYIAHGTRPIERATIIAMGGSDLTHDLEDDEINAVFAFSELLAFAGLATRQFFSQFEYCNRDVFQVVVQQFPLTAKALHSLMSKAGSASGLPLYCRSPPVEL